MTAYLADTNIVVRWTLPHDPLSPMATGAVKLLLNQGDAVYVASQSLIEFWSVATRPMSANGLGMTPAEAAKELDQIEALFPILPDIPSIYDHWRRLVETAGVSGRQAFDARLAAVMQAHGVSHLLTFNIDDFQRYPSVTAIEPRELLAQRSGTNSGEGSEDTDP